MCTGLLSFVRYCGGVVHSGEHTLTDWGVGHLCVCVWVCGGAGGGGRLIIPVVKMVMDTSVIRDSTFTFFSFFFLCVM